jgi:hypothetical protein
MKSIATTFALLLGLVLATQARAETSPAATLDAFYKAGAGADQSAFIAQLAADAVLLGVDGDARLQGQSLRDYVSESFGSPGLTNGNAWALDSSDREIRLSADGSVAWFDESLQHDQLGSGRASGVLVANGGNWKIAQYNRTLSTTGIEVSSPAGLSAAAAGTAAPAAPQKPECKQLRHKTNKKSSC